MEVSSATIKAVVEPLIDLIHGDIARADACCQRIGGAFVVAHQAQLRRLITESALLPAGLVKALEVYCVRSYLVDAPQLLTESAGVGPMLERLAASLILAAQDNTASVSPGEEEEAEGGQQSKKQQRQDGHSPRHHHHRDGAAAESPGQESINEDDAALAAALLAASGERIKAWAAARQQAQPSASQSRADLVEALGEVIIAYMMRAAQQCAQQARAYLEGGSWRSAQVAHTAFHATLFRFVRSAVESRAARARARAAAQEADVQALLFGGDAAAAVALVNSGSGEDADEVAEQQPQQGNASSPSPQDDFAAAVQAAMESVPSSPVPLQPPPPPLGSPSLLKHPIPSRSAGRKRELRAVDDSMEEQFDALLQTVTPTQQQQAERTGPPSAAVVLLGDPSPSPELVQDPSILSIAISTGLSSNGRDSIGEGGAPSRKRSRIAPVLIGATETSVLRLMADTNADSGSDVDTAVTPAAADAPATPSPVATPSSTLPLGAQATHAQEGSASADSAEVLAVVGEVHAGLQRCVQGGAAEARSYFLCAATQRFEPCVARGLL